MEVIHKIGRRKTAVARVYLSKGKGNITVNDKDFKSYFTTGTLQYTVSYTHLTLPTSVTV